MITLDNRILYLGRQFWRLIYCVRKRAINGVRLLHRYGVL